jgi:hypothetical protein
MSKSVTVVHANYSFPGPAPDLCRPRGGRGQGIRDFEDKVPSTPLVAVSLGMLAAYLFPITLILGFVARLLLFSIKPLLVIFGVQSCMS